MSIPAPANSRPVIVTVAVVLIYLGGLFAAAVGVFVLLSRYRAASADVLTVSLLGAGIILFGLLILAVGGGVGRGSRGSRLAVTGYLAVLLTLHIVTIVTTDAWDWFGFGEVVVELFILGALWLPPGSRYFRVTATEEVSEPAAA